MKQTIYFCIVAALFAFGLTGCSEEQAQPTAAHTEGPAADSGPATDSAAPPAATSVIQADLLQRYFVLRSVNGQDYTHKERVPDLEFGEGFRVFGQMCNRYTGQAALEDGKLFVRQMASTKMLCPDTKLNQLEDAFAQMVHAGADLAFDGSTLTLVGNNLEMLFDLRAKKDAAPAE